MRISDWISDVCSSDLIPLSAPPDMPVHILHLHSAFDLGGKEARAVRLMNAFGDAARHTIVSGVPDALSARDAIAPGIKYERSEEHTSELQSLMRLSYAVCCLNKKTKHIHI